MWQYQCTPPCSTVGHKDQQVSVIQVNLICLNVHNPAKGMEQGTAKYEQGEGMVQGCQLLANTAANVEWTSKSKDLLKTNEKIPNVNAKVSEIRLSVIVSLSH